MLPPDHQSFYRPGPQEDDSCLQSVCSRLFRKKIIKELGKSARVISFLAMAVFRTDGTHKRSHNWWWFLIIIGQLLNHSQITKTLKQVFTKIKYFQSSILQLLHLEILQSFTNWPKVVFSDVAIESLSRMLFFISCTQRIDTSRCLTKYP